jgi:hypothetical protein
MLRLTRPYLKTPIFFLFVLTFCSIVQAQSGRRATKPLSPPTATPTPPPSEQPQPQSKPELKPQTIVAGMEGVMDIPFYMSDAVWNGFIERFGKVSSVIISASNKNMNRKEAVDRAKKQAENFVVLLQLTTTSANRGFQVNLEDLVVSYFIFSPGTGKIKENGQVYVRTSRSVLNRRLPTGRNVESQLSDAGRETAERVMTLLHIGSTAIRP